jgi:hypothetical protein
MRKAGLLILVSGCIVWILNLEAGRRAIFDEQLEADDREERAGELLPGVEADVKSVDNLYQRALADRNEAYQKRAVSRPNFSQMSDATLNEELRQASAACLAAQREGFSQGLCDGGGGFSRSQSLKRDLDKLTFDGSGVDQYVAEMRQRQLAGTLTNQFALNCLRAKYAYLAWAFKVLERDKAFAILLHRYNQALQDYNDILNILREREAGLGATPESLGIVDYGLALASSCQYLSYRNL